jgi:rhodanese-related sulfurtransferase
MSYDLDQFIADCRTSLARDPGPKGREEVRLALERLLSNKEFVEEYCGANVPRGLKVLYEDPRLGFQVLAHINDKARVSPPHDHGASWAIYGQATHYTDMIEWEREDDGGSPDQAWRKYPRRHLPGRQDPFDRLSGQLALRARDRHQPRQDQSRALRPRLRRDPPDDAAAGDVSPPAPTAAVSSTGAPRPLEPAAVKDMLADGIGIVDLQQRKFLRKIPPSLVGSRDSRAEFAPLVPRHGTRIVLCDDDDGLVGRAAESLRRAGYADLSYLEGGVAAWARADFELFSGVNVPSKAFGEFVEHASGTPSIDASELDRLIRSGTDMVVLDSRPFEEYQRVSIPTAVNVPGAELVLRVRHGARRTPWSWSTAPGVPAASSARSR